MDWITIRLSDGTRVVLTMDNTVVFVHSQGFERYDHIFVTLDDGSGDGMYIFDNRQALQAVMDSELYRYVWSPVPSPKDIEAYERFLKSQEPPPIDQGDIDNFLKEVGEDGVIGHWYELGGDSEEEDG